MAKKKESSGSPKEPVFSKAEVDALNLRIKDLENQLKIAGNTIAELEEVHGKLKDEIRFSGANYEPIKVPAMINKPRVVAACIDVEKMASCKHVKEFIGALREYIANK